VDYVDLWLLHWPHKKRLEAWKAMEEIYIEGRCNAIGVSNFTIKHLEELIKHANIIPAVN
jgi:diketogulonate reductase-like aldo/keto reductase